MSDTETASSEEAVQRTSYTYSTKITLRDERYAHMKSAAASMNMKQRDLVQMIVSQVFEQASKAQMEAWIKTAEMRILLQQSDERAASFEKEALAAEARKRDEAAHRAALLAKLKAAEEEASQF